MGHAVSAESIVQSADRGSDRKKIRSAGNPTSRESDPPEIRPKKESDHRRKAGQGAVYFDTKSIEIYIRKVPL